MASVYSENKGSLCALPDPEDQTPIELKESTWEKRTGLTPLSLGQDRVSLERQPSYFQGTEQAQRWGPERPRPPDRPAGSSPRSSRADSFGKHFPVSSSSHTLPSHN